MIPALNMELEIVRTVLQNDVNDIYVCSDLLQNSGVFYTMISIHESKCRKLVTEKLNTDQLFYHNQDFVGSFVYQSHLNLVFRYCHENLLSDMGSVYLTSFSQCKLASEALVSACAELGTQPDMGLLLLDDRNINISREGNIDMNYFLDFSKHRANVTNQDYVQRVAELTLKILEINYRNKYSNPQYYPNEVRLFYMKVTSKGFTSLGHIISTVRGMDDNPREEHGFFGWFRKRFRRIRGFLFRNGMTAFLTILVIATIIFAAVQITNRVRMRRAYNNNVSYSGIEYIGDVYLGTEE